MARKRKTSRRTQTLPEISESPDSSDFADIPEDKIQQIVVTAMRSFSGPLPPPEMLGEYDKVLNGAADRIVRLAENEQQIRSQDNRRMIIRDYMTICGSVIIALAMIGGIVACAYFGEPAFGLFLSFGLFPMIIKSIADVRRLLSQTSEKSE